MMEPKRPLGNGYGYGNSGLFVKEGILYTLADGYDTGHED